MQSKSFNVGGRDFCFEWVSGTVIATDQRSDTHVWGGGSTTAMDGTTVLQKPVQSRVDVVRDIWLKDASGAERHYRYYDDIPVREGQTVHIIGLKGKDLFHGDPFNVGFGIYNSSINKYWTLWDVNETLKLPDYVSKLTVVAGIFLIFFYGLGLLMLFYCYSKRRSGLPWGKQAIQEREAVKAGIMHQFNELMRELKSVSVDDTQRQQAVAKQPVATS